MKKLVWFALLTFAACSSASTPSGGEPKEASSGASSSSGVSSSSGRGSRDSGAGGSTMTSRVCTPGHQVGCTCPGGGTGVQVCDPSGQGLGSCTGCTGSTGSGSGTASTGSSGSGSSSGSVTNSASVSASTTGTGPGSPSGSSSGSVSSTVHDAGLPDATVPDASKAEAGCSVGALNCNGVQPQECTASGTWHDVGLPCSGSLPFCLAGACVECTPGSSVCSANAVETCSSTGQWGGPVACSPAAPTCSQSGQSASCVCPNGETVSNGVCCPSGETGCGGVCWPADAGATECNGTCVGEQTDVNNCGGCGTTCTTGQICTGTCVPGCIIEGLPYPSGAMANDDCEICTPSASASTWTDVVGVGACRPADPSDGMEGPWGQACSGGQCVSGCSIPGTGFVSPNAVDPNNPCQSCQPGWTTTAWTGAGGVNPSCPSGEVCDGSPAACTPGCWIDETFFAPGASVRDGCELCSPASSTTSWTNAPNDQVCGAGLFCIDGSCVN